MICWDSVKEDTKLCWSLEDTHVRDRWRKKLTVYEMTVEVQVCLCNVRKCRLTYGRFTWKMVISEVSECRSGGVLHVPVEH